jgi:hypothetical protein
MVLRNAKSSKRSVKRSSKRSVKRRSKRNSKRSVKRRSKRSSKRSVKRSLKRRSKYDGVNFSALTLAVTALVTEFVVSMSKDLLSGPVSSEVWQDTQTSQLYIFLGDVHFETEGLCTNHKSNNVFNFLKKLGQKIEEYPTTEETVKRKVEFFIEGPVYPSDMSDKRAKLLMNKSSKMKDVEPLFEIQYNKFICYKPSLNPDEKNKYCIENVEMNSVDMRITPDLSRMGAFNLDNPDLSLSTIRNTLQAIVEDLEAYETYIANPNVKKVLKQANELKILSKDYFKNLSEDSYIKKLINSIKDSELKNKITQLCDNYFRYIFNDYYKEIKQYSMHKALVPILKDKKIDLTIVMNPYEFSSIFGYIRRIEEANVDIAGFILSIIKNSQISVFYYGLNHLLHNKKLFELLDPDTPDRFELIMKIKEGESIGTRCMDVESIYNIVEKEGEKEL